MIAGVADTHRALLYLLENAFPISLAEIQKGRLPTSAYDELREALNNPDFVLKEAPLTGEIVETMRRVPRVDIPDMPDRIVAATALYLSVPLISRDGRIRASSVHSVW